MASLHSGRSANWGVASRSSDLARRRWLRELAKAEVVDGGPTRTESEDVMNELYEDELIPFVSREDLAAHQPLPV